MDYGVKISKDSKNIQTSDNKELSFSSNLLTVRAFKSGVVEVTLGQNNLEEIVNVPIGVTAVDYPAVAVVGFADIGTKRIRTTFGKIAETDYLGGTIYSQLVDGYRTYNFRATRTTSSSTYPSPFTMKFKYYLII